MAGALSGIGDFRRFPCEEFEVSWHLPHLAVSARSVAGGDERVLRCGFPVQPSQGGPQKYRDATGLRGAQGTGDLSEIPGRATSFVQ